MEYSVFIDGAEGTAGLGIHERFKKRNDIEIINIHESQKKDIGERVKRIKEADVTFLCLPDNAAKEIVKHLPAGIRIIDTSSAHRTDPGWIYGMPELCERQRELIRKSFRVTNPGCHATGFILLIRPLIDKGIISHSCPLCGISVTGYSGGGKKMIEHYTENEKSLVRAGPGQYALFQDHKHLPEMTVMTGLTKIPAFSPVIGCNHSGMAVSVTLHKSLFLKTVTVSEMTGIYEERYAAEPLITLVDKPPESGYIYAGEMAGKNDLKIYILGNDERVLLTAVFDNLGKGASAAALQNMNIMLGEEETKGLL